MPTYFDLGSALGASIFFWLWYVVVLVQTFFAYGTAYRLTKRGGDNGVALFGWMIVHGLAAMVPGLGIYFWYRYKDAPKKDPGEGY